MANQYGSSGRKKTRAILVRCTPAEKSMLTAAAEACGIPTARWLREIGLEAAAGRNYRQLHRGK